MKEQKGCKYICPKCGTEEIIPYEVLEEFDMMYPEELLYGTAPINYAVRNVKMG